MQRIMLMFAILGGFLVVSLVPVSTFYAAAQSYDMPAWIKTTSKWVAEGKISESDYIEEIQYVLQHGWLRLEPKEEAGNPPGRLTPSLETIQAGQPKNCQDVNFPKVDWSNCNFSGAPLSNADLHDANLVGINLSGADLEKAYLLNTHLENSNLNYADMLNADMPYAHLQNASLVGVLGQFLDL